jgi:hypothetical protein
MPETDVCPYLIKIKQNKLHSFDYQSHAYTYISVVCETSLHTYIHKHARARSVQKVLKLHALRANNTEHGDSKICGS